MLFAVSSEGPMATLRAQDRALLERLEDEGRLRALVAALPSQSGSNISLAEMRLSPRAPALIEAMRGTPVGQAAVERLDAGEAHAAMRLLFPESYEGLAPVFCHHLALFHGELARRTLDRRHYAHALAAWSVLEEERRYLSELAQRIAPELEAEERSAAAAAAGRSVLDELHRSALADAKERGQHAHLLLTLARYPVLEKLGVQKATRARLERDAEDVIDAALSPRLENLDEAIAAGDYERQVDALVEVAALSEWAGGHRHIDHTFCDRALPIAWQLYKQKIDAPHRRLIAGGQALVDRSARRVETDSRELHQAARVAQLLVFRAEIGQATLDEQIATIDWALRVCDTHRNAHIIGASLYAHRGLRRLRASSPLTRGATAGALEDARRAKELWPESKNLVKLEEELARRGYGLID